MSTWADAVPWIVAAVGWGATHIFSEARERRKEIRAQLDKVQERLAKIEDMARSFHTSELFDQGKRDLLQYEIGRLERALNRIPKIDSDALVNVIILHRRSITYSNFDRSIYVRQDQASELIGDINSATQDFEDEIEYQYRQSYPATFPYFELRKQK
jgi:hypothetical protein